MSTQSELLAWGSAQLEELSTDSGGASPAAEARYLLAWALGVDSLLRAPLEVPSLAEASYRTAVTERARRIPRSHVTAEMYFRGLKLHAGPGVFTVRPETEMLVEHVLELIAKEGIPEGQWIDLCSGSAAIALSLSLEGTHHVTAVEMDPSAFSYAQRNVAAHSHASVGLVNGDATQASTLKELGGQVALVVTNPPYVPSCEAPTQPEAQHDPAIALYGGGNDGTRIPKLLIDRSRDLLVKDGLLAMEHSASQAQTLKEYARDRGFTQVRTLSDLAGVPRFLFARYTEGE